MVYAMSPPRQLYWTRAFYLMTDKQKKLVNVYIDGFNFYHRIKKYQEVTGTCYKWLNYKSLTESFLRDGQVLNKIYFFTAVTDYFGKGSSDRHKIYIKALEAFNITIVRGYFQIEYSSKPKEKQTDINIAVQLLEDAFNENFDIAFLSSADSDLAPAVKAVKRNRPEKIVIVVPPPFEGKNKDSNPLRILGTAQLRECCNAQKLLRFKYLANHLLSDKVYNSKGKLIVEKPKEY